MIAIMVVALKSKLTAIGAKTVNNNIVHIVGHIEIDLDKGYTFV